MYGGKFCVSKCIGLTLFLEGNLPFFFASLCIEGNFQVQATPPLPPGGGLMFGGAIKRRVFCVRSLRGLYMEGLSFGILRYSVTTLQFLIEDGILWVYIPLTVYMKACPHSVGLCILALTNENLDGDVWVINLL